MSSTNNPIRVAIVDPYPLYRQGVVHTIARTADLVIVAEGEGMLEARNAVRQGVDILLLDVAMLGNLSIEATELARNSGTKIVVLTGCDDVSTAVAALEAGVHGYLLKGISGNELIAALKAIHLGQPIVTAELGSRVLIDRASPRAKGLSERERQVLAHLSEGLTNNEIAAVLGLHVTTVKAHLTSLFKKLKVTNRVQAMKATRELARRLRQK